MLYRSLDNLEKGAISFVDNNKEVTLFSAYLKLEALKRINHSFNIKQIIVRWEVEDLCKNVSDLELYNYCLEHGIVLYRNTKIHLKAFWNGNNSVFLGSANITGRGIGATGNFNFELNAKVDNISVDDQRYLNRIILDSQYVTEHLYLELKTLVDQIELPTYNFPDLPTPSPVVDYFLINQLPMTSSVDVLYDIYCGNLANQTEINCATHDLELYKINFGLNREEFNILLKTNFNKHPFIVKFKDAVRTSVNDRGIRERDSSMNFGAVRRWFSNNTTTVPTPRPYELSDYVSILYVWICTFDGDYQWSVPGARTQVIYYKKRS